MNKNLQLREAVRQLFADEPEKNWHPREIAIALKLRGGNAQRLRPLLTRMASAGEIVELRPGLYNNGKPADLITGRLTLLRSGAGYITDSAIGDSLRIESGDIGTALPGDIVTARRFYRPKERDRGKIIKIVERSTRDVVGTLSGSGRLLYVTPLDPVYQRRIAVPEARGARQHDRVVVRLLEWSNQQLAPEGEIIEVIGAADKPSLDTTVVCRQFELPDEFPAEVMREAEKSAVRLSQPGKRLDLRKKSFIITIDPATAKDFDDAISLERDEEGRRVLGVHIADVSHFVRPGSPLDKEAAERANSVYLVDKVIPMLPEQLSNLLCSLRPNEDRLCFSAFITFDARGKMVKRHFARTIINSRLRLTYEDALRVIEGKTTSEAGKALAPEAVALIRGTNELAQQLRRQRMRDGALDIVSPEVEIILDDQSRMSGVAVRANDLSHQMIEECMVAANEAVATELEGHGITILARLHEQPDPLKLEELTIALGLLGFAPGNLKLARALGRFLKESADHPLRDHAHLLVLRSLKRAIYSAEARGHFGLAKRHYAHFTSPIRRYPDLVLHRQLADYLGAKGERGAMPAAYLKATALHCSEREQRADDAARALIEIKKFRFLQQQLDDRKLIPYAGVISKVTNYGIFIDIRELQITGLVHISTISEQFVRYNSANQSLVAGKERYRLGDTIEVVVTRIDFDERHADFVLTKGETKTRKGAKKTEKGKRVKKEPRQRKSPAGSNVQ